MRRLQPECARALVLLTLVSASLAAADAPVSQPIEQLRHAAGRWNVTTEFLNPDGSVARTVEGEYEFDWVVPDRVLLGRSRPPEPDQAAGLLFYYQESQNMVGMASVGADGHLWVMTGAADKEVRHTPPTPMPDGSIVELRFTRYNVEPEQFESKMEFSTDAGSTWTQRNHQIFRRASVPAPVGDPESNRLTWENLAASLDAEAAAGFTALS